MVTETVKQFGFDRIERPLQTHDLGDTFAPINWAKVPAWRTPTTGVARMDCHWFCDRTCGTNLKVETLLGGS
jgi:hypothetical protein